MEATNTTTTDSIGQTRTITREQWESKMHHGYASMIGGTPYILTYEEGHGTCLVPVQVEGLDSEEKRVLMVLLRDKDRDPALEREIHAAKWLAKTTGDQYAVVERLWMGASDPWRYWTYDQQTLAAYPVQGPHKIVYTAAG